MLRLLMCLALFVLTGCETFDMSQASCGTAEGQCLSQCRKTPGAGQMACEDKCREEASMCRARDY